VGARTVGLPTEIMDREACIALTPAAVAVVVGRGHRVLVQSGAGTGAGLSDAEFEAAGVALVLLVSPTTGPERLEKLCALASGYLYYVSFAGVTGDSARLDADAAGERLRAIRERAGVPVVVGFGIRDAASARAMSADADGVVVGSALVSAMAGTRTPEAAAGQAAAFLAPLRAALDAPPA